MNELSYLAVLSGARRGQIVQLVEKTLRITVSGKEEISISPPDGEVRELVYATLHQSSGNYEIEVEPGKQIWVNGSPIVESHVLQAGDLLEIGEGGPMLRYRTYPGPTPHKTMSEMFADCIDGARINGLSRPARVSRFITTLAHDITTHSTLAFRIWVIVVLTVLVISIGLLVWQNLRLQRQVALEGMRIEGMAELLEKAGTGSIKHEDLLNVQREVESRLAEAVKRVEVLEERSAAVARIVADASPAVAFIQGSFGFIDPKTKLPLRYVETDDLLLFTFDARGDRVELAFTGTGFVVTEDGLMVSNRHIAEPWLDDTRVEMAREKGLTPVIQKLIAYLPELKEPLALRVLGVGKDEDLSILRMDATSAVAPLKLKTELPRPGAQVIVLGYPLGVRALMVRTSQQFIESLSKEEDMDVWALGRRLAAAGYIKPLATQGIVSQVSKSVIVYDAETALGGSGGPVLDLSGKVVAVNFAVMKEYRGANLGIPAQPAVELLEELRAKDKTAIIDTYNSVKLGRLH